MAPLRCPSPLLTPLFLKTTSQLTHNPPNQYFKSIEQTSILKPLHPTVPKFPQQTIAAPIPTPTTNGTAVPRTLPETVVPVVLNDTADVPILQPLPVSVSSHLAVPTAGDNSRAVSPDVDLVPDRMADRINGGGFAGRLSPQPGAVSSVSA